MCVCVFLFFYFFFICCFLLFFFVVVIFQLDLVCSRTIFKSHATTAGNVGSLIGFLTLGPTADRLDNIILTKS